MKRASEQAFSAENKGIRLQILNIAIIVFACLLSIALLYAGFRTVRSYEDMRIAMEDYLVCQQSAVELQAGSDYLTEQVRSFTVTGNPIHVQNFFEEVEITRRRETALADIADLLSDTESYQHLSDALDNSNELIQLEYYAMRLTIQAREYDISEYPRALQEVLLSKEDLALSPAEQSEKAMSMVFDEVYQAYKAHINENVNLCLDTLIAETRLRQLSTSDRLLQQIRWRNVLIGALLIMVFLVVLFTSLLIIRPMKRSVFHIRRKEALPLAGSYEMRYLADAFNRVFEENQRAQSLLSYEAAHDALTGLYNRGMFERMRARFDRNNALLLADVDEFKGVNDTYGHEIGDRILQKVADCLQRNFRADDYICRVGGDEFAVIMVNAGSELTNLITAKISSINEQLNNPTDGLPPVSLSVGVAFGDNLHSSGDLYNDADVALYRVKNSTRNGCACY